MVDLKIYLDSLYLSEKIVDFFMHLPFLCGDVNILDEAYAYCFDESLKEVLDFMKECIREIFPLRTTQLYFGLILSLNPKLWDALVHVKKDYIDHHLINTGNRLTDESQEILKSFMLLGSRRSQINAYL